MTRLSDERLAAAKSNHADLAAIIGEPPGVLDSLRYNPGSAWKAHTDREDLLAEFERLGALAQECYLDSGSGREWDLVAELRTLTRQED